MKCFRILLVLAVMLMAGCRGPLSPEHKEEDYLGNAVDVVVNRGYLIIEGATYMGSDVYEMNFRYTRKIKNFRFWAPVGYKLTLFGFGGGSYQSRENDGWQSYTTGGESTTLFRIGVGEPLWGYFEEDPAILGVFVSKLEGRDDSLFVVGGHKSETKIFRGENPGYPYAKCVPVGEKKLELTQHTGNVFTYRWENLHWIYVEGPSSNNYRTNAELFELTVDGDTTVYKSKGGSFWPTPLKNERYHNVGGTLKIEFNGTPIPGTYLDGYGAWEERIRIIF